MQRQSKIKNIIQFLLIVGCGLLTFCFPKIFGSRGYYVAAFVFAVLSVGIVFLSFEKSRPNQLKIAIIAVMCTLGIAGRAVFGGIPYVKPVAAIVILTGVCMGPQSGFLSGAVIMLVSNFMFGQGPWTVWQMFAFGILGMLSGLVFYRHEKLQKPIFLAIFGFACYILIIGPILDLSGIFAYTMPGKVSLRATLIAGIPVNITGGISAFIFLMFLSKPIMSKLKRLIIKYGL